MNGQSIIDQVLQDAFPASRRVQALKWVQYRVGLIWANDEWEFVQATKNDVTITAGDNTLAALPVDMGPVLAIIPPLRDPLQPIDEYRDFADIYIGPGAMQPGLPEAFNVLDGVVYVGPQSTETADYQLVYERIPPIITDTTDPIDMPDPFEGAIVDGAKARGFTLTNDPLAAGFENACQLGLVALRRLYLRSMRGTATQHPAYRPGGVYGWDNWSLGGGW